MYLASCDDVNRDWRVRTCNPIGDDAGGITCGFRYFDRDIEFVSTWNNNNEEQIFLKNISP